MTDELKVLAKNLVASGKGILACDESESTIGARFSKVGLVNTFENRMAYREMVLGAQGLATYISGVILHEETLKSLKDKPKGVALGVKVDKGYGEDGITRGLPDLKERLVEARRMGVRFCKWRAVFWVHDDKADERIAENCAGLAKYCRIATENGFVPIVEPEVLREGGHTENECALLTNKVLVKLFEKLFDEHVDRSEIVLKTNMVTAGDEMSDTPADVVARETTKVLRSSIGVDVPGVAFLSGGIEEKLATKYLNAINRVNRGPWKLTFSFSRAILDGALKKWAEDKLDCDGSQRVVLHRARMNSLASVGKYKEENEYEI